MTVPDQTARRPLAEVAAAVVGVVLLVAAVVMTVLALRPDGTIASSEQTVALPSASASPTTAPSPSPPSPTQVPPSRVPSPTPVAPATARTTAPTSSRPAPPAAPDFPAAVQPEHGGEYAGVFLAVARTPDDRRLEKANDQARAAGYDDDVLGIGDIGCSEGAREALGLDPDEDYYAAALYFADMATAKQFVDAFEPGVVGTAVVRTYCLD